MKTEEGGEGKMGNTSLFHERFQTSIELGSIVVHKY